MGLFGAFSAKPMKDAVATAAKATETGRLQGTSDLDQGYASAADSYGKAGDLFDNLAASYGKGSQLYADALGVNGQDASTAARSAFTATPGYTFTLDQGLQSLQRMRAVNGTLASGNADTDAMKFASGLASNDFNNWLQNLSGYDGKTMAATTGQAGTFGALGSLGYQTGAAKAGLDTSAASAVAQGAYKVGEAQQKANEAKLGALFGVGNLLAKGVGAFTGGGGGAFSIFGGGSSGLGAGKDSDWI